MDDDDNQQEWEAYREVIHQCLLNSVPILITVAGWLITSACQKVPYHTSILTGKGWVRELLEGHPERIRCELGVYSHVFTALVSELRESGHQDSRFVSLEEQLVIFLYSCVTGLTIRHIGEWFQRSNDTISKCFKKMLCAFSSVPFYTTHVHFPVVNNLGPVSSRIHGNPKFWLFFKDALGAIDGSHIHCAPPARERASYRNRKGFISQNCLFTCSFDLDFIYAYTGWEGSVTDARIFEAAHSMDFIIPAGKYYLADAGFPSCDGLLTPYRGVRYHLAEWGRAGQQPENEEELFNLRHSSARNVIERIFGVLKCRFRILLLAPEFNLDIQAQIPVALCAIHNFIHAHDPNEVLPMGDQFQHHPHPSHPGTFAAGVETRNDANDRRDRIAQEMWDDYQRVCQERDMEATWDDDLSDDEYDAIDEGNPTDAII